MTDDPLCRRLKALADPVRLRIVQLLPPGKSCEDVYNVSELAEELKLAQPTVSHHLRILKDAGLVRSERMCRDVYYYLDKAALREVTQGLVNFGR